MNKIASFQVDHTKLERGVFVSREDFIDTVYPPQKIVTFDLRMCKPYVDTVMNTDIIHTIEHIGATFLRNDAKLSEKTIYFGPMGCRTGFYLILKGDWKSIQIIPDLKRMFLFISNFEGDIPGASKVECGNYEDMNLVEAKLAAKRYLGLLNSLRKENLYYPE